MSITQTVEDLAKRVRDEIHSNLGRYQNQTFRDACMAICALVAMADGVLADDERKKVIACIQNTEALGFFEATEMRDIFLGFCELAKDEFARVEVIKAIRRVKGDSALADRVVKIGIIIAKSDRTFATVEKAVIEEVIAVLALNGDDYDLSGAEQSAAPVSATPSARPAPTPVVSLPPYVAGNSLKVGQKGERIALKQIVAAVPVELRAGFAFDKTQPAAEFSVSARVYGKDKQLIGVADVQTASVLSSALVHKGNTRAASPLGDDQEIILNLAGLLATAGSVVFVLTAAAASVRDLRKASLRLVDPAGGQQLLSFDHALQSPGKAAAIVLARLYVHNGEWKFQAIGEEIIAPNADSLNAILASMA